MPGPPPFVALSLGREHGALCGVVDGSDVSVAGPVSEVVAAALSLEGRVGPRWVWWSAASEAWPLVRAHVPIARCWDVAEVHRLRHGGWRASPELAWAAVHDLDPRGVPAPPGDDLFDLLADDDGLDPEALVRPDGHLRADAVVGRWQSTPQRAAQWAAASLTVAERQREDIGSGSPSRSRALATAISESAAALLCLELERDGLPIDRPVVEDLIARSAGVRPSDEAQALVIRRERDARVLAHAPGRPTTDLRNPAQVKEMLASAGVDVPNTRKWTLEAYRDTHPLVEALLTWRKDERIATTYGYGWLDRHVGADDRLRGAWTACDGAAGRMTAQNGLHNLPADLRPAVAAQPGHVLVRADLGQIEPRVLAAVTEDDEFARATQADDLYAPVAQRLGVERAVAKVAVLAAMYGQRSGAAGEALKGLERAYPVAMAHLDRAYEEGRTGRPVRTHGGRLVRTDFSVTPRPAEAEPSAPSPDAGPRTDSEAAAARGRFARNAVIQGSAAELFKAWAATVRAGLRSLPRGDESTAGQAQPRAEIVLCLHDELLIHTPAESAQDVVDLVRTALDDSARRWTGSTRVRFVADVSVVDRWSEAKG
ncbi:DNA polymerase [Janibacter sp. G1551]|uniref:DNA polymerase n=1 Tax=Janibacter sp. G1551 TaxID=3420440 RepID=UPI003CFDE3A1